VIEKESNCTSAIWETREILLICPDCSKQIKLIERNGPLTLTPKEAAIRSGIGINTIYEICRDNPAFPAFRVGKKTLIPVEAFDKWVADLGKRRSGFKK